MGGRKSILLISIAGGTLALDQTTKWAVKQSMTLYESIAVIPGLFHLTYIQNAGAAFGILSNATEFVRVYFLIGISIAALIVLGILFKNVPSNRKQVLIPLALIIGGASGNLIDRIYQQRVIDFLDFFWKDFHWPSFNIADSAITVGAIALIAVSLFSKERDIFSKGGEPCNP
jgi:signal peptidase II